MLQMPAGESSGHPKSPLPISEVPFERIGMDLIRPLKQSAQAHLFMFVLVDSTTQYPEAVPVVEALFQVISCVTIPKEILTNQALHSRHVDFVDCKNYWEIIFF